MVEPKKFFKDLTRTPPVFEDRIGKVYRFDRNEKTTAFPKEHLRTLLASIHPEEMIAYPQPEPFYEKLANWLGVDRRQVLLTSGSDTAIKAVFEVYVEEGDEVVMLSPTYGMYGVYCRMYGAVPKEIAYNEDLSLPPERILDEITGKTKLVAIANPNHTGTVVAEEDLFRIIDKALANEALVLMDEAYHHFYSGTMINHLNTRDNLIIVRTFSKGFGVAPLRIGYIVANQELTGQLFKVKLTHELTGFAVKTGMYLLDHLDILTDYVNEVQKGKEVLYQRLAALDFEVLRSEANFVYFKPPVVIDGEQLMAELEKKNIYLKGPFTSIPFSGHIRVTTGTEAQMDMLCDEITSILQNARPKEAKV